MNLETKWLEDFVALAATRSFSQAAEKRFVTQPAFSRRIRSLEGALGLTLVNRSCTPVELTESGQLFLVTARNVVEQLGEAVRHLHHLEGEPGGVLQVAAGSLVLAGVLLAALVSPWFVALPAFVGAGLVFAGLSGTCGMAHLLRRMPWNTGAAAR